MAGIRGANTAPEVKVRKLLHKHGVRYRLHPKNLPGKPDLVLARYGVCIFVHGCFWHRHQGCRFATTPRTRTAFWHQKFEQNVNRDIRNRDQLLKMGWRVFELWECGIREIETEISWLLDAIKDTDLKYVTWPDRPLTN